MSSLPNGTGNNVASSPLKATPTMSFLPNVASSSLKTTTPIMSLQLSNGGNNVASAIGNGSSTSESELLSFQRFFEHWIVEQNKYLQDLISASKHHEQANASTMAAESKDRADHDEVRITDKPHFRPLIDQVIQHYEQYYQAKSRCAKHDAIGVLKAPWTSALENSFMWIGGWRPSMAFHLLYSKSGQQTEEKLASFVQGTSSRGDLGDLSPSQLSKVDELHRRTIREEREITEKMAKHQETVADSAMVELSHAVTELIRSEGEGRSSGAIEKELVDSVLAFKEERLAKILLRADDLRLRTLKEILDVFTPIQAVHFLIAAAELRLRLHDSYRLKLITRLLRAVKTPPKITFSASPSLCLITTKWPNSYLQLPLPYSCLHSAMPLFCQIRSRTTSSSMNRKLFSSHFPNRECVCDDVQWLNLLRRQIYKIFHPLSRETIREE